MTGWEDWDAWTAYDSSPPHGSELSWTRVYLSGGRHAHLRHEDGSARIACAEGRPRSSPYWHGTEEHWHGTGCQKEYDHAAALPLCPKCFAVREAAQIGISTDQTDPEERGRTLP